MIVIVLKDSRRSIITNVIGLLHCNGISLKEMQANRCLINVCPNIIAVRMHQAGLMVRIQQWLKGLSNVKYVLVGSLDAVNGP